MNIIKKLVEKKLIDPPTWMADNIHYLTITGSMAYGCNDKDKSDYDIYGICIPPKEQLFPHLAGGIIGFAELTTANLNKRFNVWQQHHVIDKEEDKEYDLSIYNIVDYCQLCMNANPNMIDTLYTPEWCIQHITPIGRYIRDHRKYFLSKKCFSTFRGYSSRQLHNAQSTKDCVGKRKESIEKFGWDVKFGYHLARLLDEIEQIITIQDLDLTRSREYMKSIRRGETSKDQVMAFFDAKMITLEKLYAECTLPDMPDTNKIRDILLTCLERHYGDLTSVVVKPDASKSALLEIKRIIESSGV